MSDESHDIESKLRTQRAAGLGANLLNRLEAAADGSLIELSTLEKQFEAELRNIQPARLSPSLTETLENSAKGTPFPLPQTVVPFQKQQAAPPKRSNPSWWSTAAAVALFGAAAALMLPNRKDQSSPISHASPPGPGIGQNVLANPSLTNATPASFTRKLHETSDQGVVWSGTNQPHRVIKVVYIDEVTMQHDDGTSSQVEQPQVEYYIVPVEAD